MNDSSGLQLRVLIVGDFLLVRAGLRMLLENQPEIKVVAMAGDRREALELASRESPDLILLDLDLPSDDGTSFLPELREAAKNARVLILTSVRDLEAHRRVVRLGAMGVVLKQQTPEVLIKAIKKVHAGEVWLDQQWEMCSVK